MTKLLTHTYHVSGGPDTWTVWTHELGTAVTQPYARDVTEDRAAELCRMLADAGYTYGRS